MRTVFLGGTLTSPDWRKDVIAYLVSRGISEDRYFNPVVEHWDAEAQQREEEVKANPEAVMLYYLGDTGNANGIFLSFYSLLEATMGLYDAPQRTVVVFDVTGLIPRAQKKLLRAWALLKERFPDAPIFDNIKEAQELVASLLLR